MTSKNDAIKDLQSRLAERLQAVRHDDSRTGWLAVEAAGAGFLFPLQQAGEIFSMVEIQPLAHTRAWFCGVANLRGGLHGVVDLACFLGLRAAPLPTGDSARDPTRLVAFNASVGSMSALRVDQMSGLRHAEEMTPVASRAERPAFAPRLWRDAAGRRWQEIDLAELAASDTFIAIAEPASA